MSRDVQAFVERAGLVFESEGMPRMAGRVLGYLMVCSPPQQSIAQLMEALQASNGSISTTTRFLEEQGYIQRIPVKGDRKDYFALPAGMAAKLLASALRGIESFRVLFDDALAFQPGPQRAALREARGLFDELAHVYAKLLASR